MVADVRANLQKMFGPPAEDHGYSNPLTIGASACPVHPEAAASKMSSAKPIPSNSFVFCHVHFSSKRSLKYNFKYVR
ncbi:Protein of unknown function [Gryllus bimaculatus]|nr:Protein of unknown function [Gryllus bimaculatus]